MTKGKTKQREQQIRIDKPLQYMFAFDYNQEEDEPVKSQTSEISKAIHADALSKSILYQTFPLAKN